MALDDKHFTHRSDADADPDADAESSPDAGAKAARSPTGAKGKEVRDRLRTAVKSLDQVPIKSELEAEIIGRLIDAKLTVSELVHILYGAQRQDGEFFAYYMKVKRAMKSLAARGLVTTKLFGRDKPYALTAYGVQALADIGGGIETQAGLIPTLDRGLYAVTAGLAAGTLGVARWAQPSHTTILAASSLLFFFIGVAFTRAVQTIRRVF